MTKFLPFIWIHSHRRHHKVSIQPTNCGIGKKRQKRGIGQGSVCCGVDLCVSGSDESGYGPQGFSRGVWVVSENFYEPLSRIVADRLSRGE
jgi:hypothetical protein